MGIIWRPKSPQLLTEEQKKAKLKKDSEYEIAHLNLVADFKAGKITQADFEVQHTKQWNDYFEWSKVNGLYEEITPEQQLTEAEFRLNEQITRINEIRVELKKPEIEVKEKTKK
jgi:hypothetical protein